MGNMKTPGVYILEKNAFPNSVVEVATAVPAFIGYTEIAENKGNDLHNKPWLITSMAEFEQYFGGEPTAKHVRFSLTAMAVPTPPAAGSPPPPPAPVAPPTVLGARDAVPLNAGGTKYLLQQTSGLYLLHYSMRLFFQNGGGSCYIVSVGTYNSKPGVQVAAADFLAGIKELEKEQEPTMVVMPECILLNQGECFSTQVQALMHCGQVMQNRMAILDVWEGYQERNAPGGDYITKFRGGLGINALAYGAAYYPWVNSSIVAERDLSYANLDTASQTDTM